MSDPLQFFLAVLTLLVTPGPTNTVMATAGAGPRRSPVLLLLAELTGYLAIIWLARLALLPLIDLYPPAGIAVKVVVILYLCFAAFRLWRNPIAVGTDAVAVGPRLVFFTTMLNPKGLIFAVAVFPRDHPQLYAYFLAFAVLVGVCGLTWFSLGRGLSLIAGSRASLLPRVAAIALLGFAAVLAISIGR
jgi:threonine/homoserine/homoserine lactone efflux protein